MADGPARSFAKISGARACLDQPATGAQVYAECISVAGWLYVEGRDPGTCCVSGWINGERVGGTDVLAQRPDVCAALQIPAHVLTGFRFFGAVPEGLGECDLVLTAAWAGDPQEYKITRVPLRLVSADLRRRPYGDVVHPGQEAVLQRANIYGSGPPVEEPGPEMLQLIQQYLSPGASVLDVGCGAGAYGPALIAAGHQWLGLEVQPACWELLERRGLPYRKVESDGALPCRDGEFENAICIEVLEHIAPIDSFLREVSRAVQSRVLFSVPNMEVLPYFSAWQVVPWHLLEADHKNFFTRSSLAAVLRRHFARVEVFSYAEHPLRMPNGIPLHVHLFAIAEKERSSSSS